MTSKVVSVGKGLLVITDENFLNGYQAGHLAYMAQKHMAQDYAIQVTDSHVTPLFIASLENIYHSDLFNTGFIVGWMSTFANKGNRFEKGREV